MKKLTKYRKLLKYGALRHLPGNRGQRYDRKYLTVLARGEFEEAMRHSAGMICIDLGANGYRVMVRILGLSSSAPPDVVIRDW